MKKKTNPILVVVALFIATFLSAIEGTIVSTAMPKIAEELQGSELYTWVISIYLLANVISIPIFGKLADLYGRKSMFTIGVLIFLVGSTLCGFAQSMDQLVIYRFIQGIGGGALATIPFTIIGDIFPYEKRAKVQGWIGSVWGISGILGPLAGGFIVDFISWHWIFLMNIPFGILSLIVLWVSLFEQIEKKKQVIDYPGILAFAVSMTSLLYALTVFGSEKRLTGGVLLFGAISLIGLILFVWIEMRSKEPMLPLSLFRVRVLTISNAAGFLLGVILVATTFYIPLWAQGVTNMNATFSGFAILPMSVTWTFSGILTGKWLATQSPTRIAVIGVIIITGACVGLAMFEAGTTLAWMMLVSTVLGFGFGMVMTTFTVAVQSAFDWSIRGAAMGSHSLMRTLGQTLGISLSGIWLSDELHGHALETSLHTIFLLLLGLAVFTIGVTAFLGAKKQVQES